MKETLCVQVTMPAELKDVPVEVRYPGEVSILLNVCSGEQCQSLACNARYAFVWAKNDFVKVKLDDITCIEADGRYSKIHFSNHAHLMITSNIGALERSLPASDFIRVHNSFVVNMRHVSGLIGYVLRVGDRSVVISRKYKENFFRRFPFLGANPRGGNAE